MADESRAREAEHKAPDTLEGPSPAAARIADAEPASSSWWDGLQSVHRSVVDNIRSHSQDLEKQLHSFIDQNADGQSIDSVKQLVSNFGHAAGDYIDQADRQLEQLETSAFDFLRAKSSEIATKAKDIYNELEVPEDSLRNPQASADADSSFTGSERKPVNRLDAQLMALHTTPSTILSFSGATEPLSEQNKSKAEKLLQDNRDLSKLYNQVVPSRLDDTRFWQRYFALRSEYESQDRRRKELLAQQSVEEEDGWGSSDDEAVEESRESEAKTQ